MLLPFLDPLNPFHPIIDETLLHPINIPGSLLFFSSFLLLIDIDGWNN